MCLSCCIQHTVSWFCVFTLLCTEVASTNGCSENYTWRPIELSTTSSLLRVGDWSWGATDFVNGNCNQSSAGSSAETQWRESCCNWLWQDQLLLRVVIQSHNNRQEGVNLFYMSSQHLLYVYIWDTCIPASKCCTYSNNLVQIQLFYNMQATQRKEKTRRPISEKLNWAWRHYSINWLFVRGSKETTGTLSYIKSTLLR